MSPSPDRTSVCSHGSVAVSRFPYRVTVGCRSVNSARAPPRHPNPNDGTWDLLRRRLGGRLVLPGGPGYDEIRKPALARYSGVQPRAVVLAKTVAEVAEAIGFAGRSGLRVSPRAGGHCFAGRSSAGDIVIDVSPMREVSVTGDLVSVAAGVRLGELDDLLAAHGRVLPAGCGRGAGMAGLTLGGGLGILGRAHGLTCDHLVRAEVVLADGNVVECDDGRHPDLFWALRGAGSRCRDPVHVPDLS